MSLKSTLLLGAVLSVALAPVIVTAASARDASPPESAPSPSLKTFADTHPECQEWTDGCTICVRPADGKFGCSLPGIACQPKELACRSDKDATSLPSPPAPYSAPNPGDPN